MESSVSSFISYFSVACYTKITSFYSVGSFDMEALAYILVLTLALGTIFFAIAFREPPRIETKKDE
jgi:photosystem II PsbT protein